jgi:hypothetical protein
MVRAASRKMSNPGDVRPRTVVASLIRGGYAAAGMPVAYVRGLVGLVSPGDLVCQRLYM